jgi:signal transduction histidine kinase
MITEINKLAKLTENVDLTLFRKKANSLEDINNIIVHNIRGVASNIKMLVEMLLTTYVHKDGQPCTIARNFSLEQGLSYIGESSTSLINILNNLMKGIDDNAGSNAEYDHCDFFEMVNEITLQLNCFILDKNANIQLRLGIAQIAYPKCYMESLLYNLISNSLKYARPGIPAEITVASWEENDRTRLSVKDNGLGIDLDRHGDKIFGLGQVFHKGYDSKGIGLYITKKQIEALGGHIDVRSQVNEGTEFIVTI